MGPSIKYVRNVFRKPNISNPLIRTLRMRMRGLQMLVFRKILRTYLMDDPYKYHPKIIHFKLVFYGSFKKIF